MKLLKPLKYTFIAFAALCCSCTHTHPYDDPIIITPERDMYETWNGSFSNMRSLTSMILKVNRLITDGDTLKAQQALAASQYVIHGMEKSLDKVGTRWVGYNATSSDTAFTIAHTIPDVLTFVVPCPKSSKYNHSSTQYGCKTHYSVTLQQDDKGIYRVNGSGYIDTDGSADLNFEMHDVMISGHLSGKLTLTAYAHKYDQTVTYHYTIYERAVECEETKQDIYTYRY